MEKTMDFEQAKAMAEILGGESWDSGCGICLIRIEREDGRLVVVSDDVVCEYENEAAFEENRASNSIILH